MDQNIINISWASYNGEESKIDWVDQLNKEAIPGFRYIIWLETLLKYFEVEKINDFKKVQKRILVITNKLYISYIVYIILNN